MSTVDVRNALILSTSFAFLVASSSASSTIHMPRSFSGALSPSTVLKLSLYHALLSDKSLRNVDFPIPCEPYNTGI